MEKFKDGSLEITSVTEHPIEQVTTKGQDTDILRTRITKQELERRSEVVFHLPDDTARNINIYPCLIYAAYFPVRVEGVSMAWGNAASDAGTRELSINKNSTTAGTGIFTEGFNVKATANTVYFKGKDKYVTDFRKATLTRGDYLYLVQTSAWASIAGLEDLVVTLHLTYLDN